jgi:hypothetical protein
MAVLLIKIAMDEKAPYAVRLAAIRDVLDRAGLGAKQAVEVGVELQPWEELLRDVAFDGVARITRAQHEAFKARAQYGVLPDVGPAALPTPTLEIVGAEPLPGRKPPVLTPSRYVDDADAPGSIDVADGTSATSTMPVSPPLALDQDQAAAVMRESRIRSRPVRREPKRRGR